MEGDTDARIYRNLIDGQECHVQPAHGKRNVIGAVGTLSKGRVNGIVGVIDADYSAILGLTLSSPDILSTDSHDLETMILQSRALEKVLNEYGTLTLIRTAETRAGKSIRDLLLDAALPVGCLRLISEKRNLGLKFDGINFRAFVDPSTLRTDARRLVLEVERNTSRSTIRGVVTEVDVNAEAALGHDPWHLCCGHDLVEVLSIGLQRIFGSRPPHHVKPVVLEQSLRLAYEVALFSNTRLYRHLESWEKGHSPYKILAVS